MLTTSAHKDTFARDNLPAPETWPDLLLNGFDNPNRLNAGVELTDAMVAARVAVCEAIASQAGASGRMVGHVAELVESNALRIAGRLKGKR